jgi:DNA-binding transcriptional regulator YiaG
LRAFPEDKMAKHEERPLAQLVSAARDVLPISYDALAMKLDSSKRTLQRWQAGESRPTADQLAMLARLVHATHAPLSSEIAAAAGETLVSLGLEDPPAPPVAPRAMPRHLVVDAVVCSAAEATDVAPSGVRTILLAAFRQARELGLSTEEVHDALEARASSRVRSPVNERSAASIAGGSGRAGRSNR